MAKLTAKSSLKTPRDRQCALDMVDDLGKLMHQLSRDNVLALVAAYTRSHDQGERCPHPNYPYANLHSALTGTLRLLGVPEGNLMDDAITAVVEEREPAVDVIKAYTAAQ